VAGLLRRRLLAFLGSALLLSAGVVAWAWSKGPGTWTADSRVSVRGLDGFDLAAAVAPARVVREGESFRLIAVSPSPAGAVTGAHSAANAALEAGRSHSARLAQALDPAVLQAQDRLAIAEAEARRGETKARDLDRRVAAVNVSLAEIDRQREETLARRDRDLARARALEADEHRLREALPVGPEEDALRSPLLERIRKEMDKVRSEIALGGLAREPENPEYKARRERLLRLQEELRAELYRERARKISALRESAAATEREVQILDERAMRKGLDLAALEEARRLGDPQHAEVALARKALEDAVALRARAAGAGVEIDQKAVEARPEGGAGWGGVPAGLALAVVLALLFAGLRERADRRVRSDGDVRRYLGLPGLALVEEHAGGDPIVLRLPAHDPLSEAYATAATVLRSYLAEREFKAVLVTSAEPAEGKSTAAVNLAASLARKGLSVVLVDADFRAPRLHSLFGTENAQGLSTQLVGGGDANSGLVATELPTLHLLPAGPTTEVPPETLESSRMTDLLRSLRERYDAVVVDGPPVLAAGEALALARMVDTTVWVVRSGQADGRTLGWTRQLLKNVRADVAGVVLNCAPGRSAGRLYDRTLAVGDRR
jgi:capsular exopolysaccharide synthesis family protein